MITNKSVLLIVFSCFYLKTCAHVLDDVPLVDGHNDLPNNLFLLEQNRLNNFSFTKNLTLDKTWGVQNCNVCFTDLPRLRQGKVGAQFWSAYTACDTQYRDSVANILEQIDVIKRLVKKYPNDLQLVTDSVGIIDAFSKHKIASLIGIEGGHAIDSRFAVLRMLYELGARYMTLTHTCQTPWADASPIDMTTPVHNLTKFGKKIVKEMNRLGMLVDLSHVSHNVMNQAINASRAPVIFSHSSAWEITNHHRNVRDDTLKMLKRNGGIIMVNFFSEFVSANTKNATINDVTKHINHIVNVIGVDNIGIGGDYDGVDSMPKGLDDVSKYPDLFDLLAKENATRWSVDNLKKLAGLNLIRVFGEVERIRDSLISEEPMQEWIALEDLKNVEEQKLLLQCRTYLGKAQATNDSDSLTAWNYLLLSTVFMLLMHKIVFEMHYTG